MGSYSDMLVIFTQHSLKLKKVNNNNSNKKDYTKASFKNGQPNAWLGLNCVKIINSNFSRKNIG